MSRTENFKYNMELLESVQKDLHVSEQGEQSQRKSCAYVSIPNGKKELFLTSSTALMSIFSLSPFPIGIPCQLRMRRRHSALFFSGGCE